VDHGQASEDLGKWHLHGPSDDLIGGPSLRVTRLPYAGSTARVSLTLIAGEEICRTGQKICPESPYTIRSGPIPFCFRWEWAWVLLPSRHRGAG